MAKEIERKFLVNNDSWKKSAKRSHTIEQAYLQRKGKTVVRVRIVNGKTAFLTIKSAQPGLSRDEFEYRIPVSDARTLLKFRDGLLIKKRRFIVPAGKRKWEIDVFAGDHAGLVIAEIELGSENETFERPSWLGKDVTRHKRYYNASLAAKAAVLPRR